MKKMVLKSILFAIGLIICSTSIAYISSSSRLLSDFWGKQSNSMDYNRENVNGGPVEIIPSIYRAQKESEHTKIILGDSVTNQVFNGLNGYNDVYLLLGTNQAIGLSGQYLLAEQFIESHENVTDIYLILIPGSLASNFDRRFGYQYAVMPFVETDLFSRLDSRTLEEAENLYGKLFLNKSIVNIIDYSPMNRKIYLNMLYNYGPTEEKTGTYISDIAVNQYMQLKNLCEEKDINFHLLPGPVPDTENVRVMIEQQKEELTQLGVMEDFEEYFSYITYYDSGYFPDGVHPNGGDGTRRLQNSMIYDLQKNSGKLLDLILGDMDKHVW